MKEATCDQDIPKVRLKSDNICCLLQVANSLRIEKKVLRWVLLINITFNVILLGMIFLR